MSDKIKNPTILALNSGDLITEMNLRISERNGTPLDRDLKPQVHTLNVTRKGKHYMKSLDGVPITQKEGIALLDLAVNKGFQVENLAIIKADPKAYRFAYVRDGHKDDEGKYHSFGSLYVSETAIQHWELATK